MLSSSFCLAFTHAVSVLAPVTSCAATGHVCLHDAFDSARIPVGACAEQAHKFNKQVLTLSLTGSSSVATWML